MYYLWYSSYNFTHDIHRGNQLHEIEKCDFVYKCHYFESEVSHTRSHVLRLLLNCYNMKLSLRFPET